MLIMKTTIKDVARETGMSVSTVSLVLSGKDSRLSSSTKEKVLKVAKSLNYRRNYMASGLITKKTQVLGVIVPDISNEFFAKIAKGIGAEAEKSNYRIMLLDTDDSPEKDIAAVNTLLERSVDGMLYIHSASGKNDCAMECVKMCEAENTPVVLLDRVPDNADVNAVLIDQEQGGYIATKHLIELGHTRIGCIAGSIATGPTRKRLYGYMKSLKEAGLLFEQALVVEGGYNVDSGYQLTQTLLDRDVTAIFAFNDLIAYGTYKYIRDRNLKMPEDLSMVGFDNISFSEIMEIPLTTIHQPAYEMGMAAVQKMIQILNGKECEKTSVFKPRLIMRKSTSELIRK